MQSGIYKITNTQNNKVYIGKSKNVQRRFKAHIDHLNAGTHINKSLQEDFDIYKERAFRFEIIEHTRLLNRKESIHCYENSVWDPNKGYNTALLKDYRVISFEESLELGEKIIKNIVSKNPHVFNVENKEWIIPVSIITRHYNLDEDVINIALSEVLSNTDMQEFVAGWVIRYETVYATYSLNFFNNHSIENSIKSVSFF